MNMKKLFTTLLMISVLAPIGDFKELWNKSKPATEQVAACSAEVSVNSAVSSTEPTESADVVKDRSIDVQALLDNKWLIAFGELLLEEINLEDQVSDIKLQFTTLIDSGAHFGEIKLQDFADYLDGKGDLGKLVLQALNEVLDGLGAEKVTPSASPVRNDTNAGADGGQSTDKNTTQKENQGCSCVVQ